MATISADQRYTELLTHLEFEDWLIFVRGATHVIQEFTGEDMSLVYGVYAQAKVQGVDLTEEKWKTALWSLGAYADFIERLERATGPVQEPAGQPGAAAPGSDAE